MISKIIDMSSDSNYVNTIKYGLSSLVLTRDKTSTQLKCKKNTIIYYYMKDIGNVRYANHKLSSTSAWK